MEDGNCCRCGKNLYVIQKGCETVEQVIGMQIKVNAGEAVDIIDFKKQLGKYEIGTEYNFCFECLLDALFK